MRKILIFCIAFIMMLSMCSCKANEDPEEIITVNYRVEVVEKLVQIPVEYEVSDTLKEKGFLSIEKKEDGLAVYKIKRKDYNEYISQLEASKKEIFDRCNIDYYPYVTSVSYNDDLTKITIAVDKSEYENVSYDNESGYSHIRSCIVGCSNNVALYHSLSTGDFKECEIEVVDSSTGDVLETIYSPKAILEKDY